MSDTPTTNAVAKAIGRLAAEYRGGERNALGFAQAADAAMDPLREVEREKARLSSALDQILTDPKYEGGVQFWIRRHDDLLLELAKRLQRVG